MGHNRSISKVAREYHAKKKLRALMGRWSKKYRWVERARAYDEHLDAAGRKETREELEKMRKRHLTLSLSLQAKAAEKLKKLDGKKMRVSDAIKAIATGTKLERLTRGEPTEQVKGEIETTISAPGPMPWQNIPEVEKAVKKLRKKLLAEKAAEKDGTPAT